MSRRAEIVQGPTELTPEAGRRRFAYIVEKDGTRAQVVIEISAAAMEASPRPIAQELIHGKGRVAIERALARGTIPAKITLEHVAHSVRSDRAR
jgi:hypothetical protein